MTDEQFFRRKTNEVSEQKWGEAQKAVNQVDSYASSVNAYGGARHIIQRRETYLEHLGRGFEELSEFILDYGEKHGWTLDVTAEHVRACVYRIRDEWIVKYIRETTRKTELGYRSDPEGKYVPEELTQKAEKAGKDAEKGCVGTRLVFKGPVNKNDKWRRYLQKHMWGILGALLTLVIVIMAVM